MVPRCLSFPAICCSLLFVVPVTHHLPFVICHNLLFIIRGHSLSFTVIRCSSFTIVHHCQHLHTSYEQWLAGGVVVL
jgi:hypothetical protein